MWLRQVDEADKEQHKPNLQKAQHYNGKWKRCLLKSNDVISKQFENKFGNTIQQWHSQFQLVSTLTQPLLEHLDHVVSDSHKCPSQDSINVGNGWRKQSLRNFTSMILYMNCKIKWQSTQHDTFRARCCWNYTNVGLVESICKDIPSCWRISTYIKQTLQHTTINMRLLATWSNTSKRWMSNYYLSKNKLHKD